MFSQKIQYLRLVMSLLKEETKATLPQAGRRYWKRRRCTLKQPPLQVVQSLMVDKTMYSDAAFSSGGAKQSSLQVVLPLPMEETMHFKINFLRLVLSLLEEETIHTKATFPSCGAVASGRGDDVLLSSFFLRSCCRYWRKKRCSLKQPSHMRCCCYWKRKR